MLALGETAILPGLLLIVFLASATFWVLDDTLRKKRSLVTMPLSIALVVVASIEAVGIIKDWVRDWPAARESALGDWLFNFVFCVVPLLAGLFALVKLWKDKRVP